jgi:phospholipid/cholesterol/gamma-HCH transport system permease protein
MATTLRPRPSPSLAAHAHVHREADVLVVALAGEWTLQQSPPRLSELIEALPAPAAPTGARPRAVAFEASSLGRWDSSLLLFLRQAQEYCETVDLEFDVTGLPENVTRLLVLVDAVPERVVVAEPAATRLARLGNAAVSQWDAALAAITFTGQVALAFSRLLVGRERPRWRDFQVALQSSGPGALPIVTLIALLVGVIIAFLGVVVLKRFGAGYYVSYLVGYGMLREMGALMTGIIMAGRTGAAFAAELGSMKINEEIDAYTTLGISPVEHLVLPRMLGLFVMMPLLAIYAVFVGVGGGLLVAVTMLDLGPTQFLGGLLSVVTMSDALLGIFKATIFGVIIGLAGCMKGLQTGSDAGAVGRSATAAVVLGITFIILANAVIDWLAALLQI